jgi:putative membrane protein
VTDAERLPETPRNADVTADPALPAGSALPADPATPPAIATTAGASALPPSGTGLADGEWHRLHPATPLLRGGIALIAVLGIVLNTLRERFIEMFVPGGNGEYGGDPIDWIMDEGYVGIALAVVAGGLVLFIGAFYLSWRMHTFRITNELVEVRSGILFRTNRRGRLDRIQGINIVRPFIARLLGAAKLEVNVAGQDANVQLAYLSSSNADDLRRDILRLASGTQRADEAAAAARAGTGSGAGHFIDQRVSELLAPELDPNAAPPDSVVKLSTGRLLGSILLGDTAIVLLLFIVASIVAVSVTGEPFLLVGLLPAVIGMGSFLIGRFVKSLRYSIAGTSDGVRVGFGLLSTSNETLPPGRIHSIQVSQPVLWRPLGWWEIKVNRASKSSTQGASGQQNTTILPVGKIDDVMRVLDLMLPGLVDDTRPITTAEPIIDAVPAAESAASSPESVVPAGEAVVPGGESVAPGPESAAPGMGVAATSPEPAAGAVDVAGPPTGSRDLLRRGLVSRGGDDGFVNSPRRAAPLRWFSWRRNGYAFAPATIVLRKGAIWRELIIVPQPRVQSVALTQGPLLRRLGLASLTVHTVAGPITARLGAVDSADALHFFAESSRSIVESASSDTSHRWRSGEAAL